MNDSEQRKREAYVQATFARAFGKPVAFEEWTEQQRTSPEPDMEVWDMVKDSLPLHHVPDLPVVTMNASHLLGCWKNGDAQARTLVCDLLATKLEELRTTALAEYETSVAVSRGGRHVAHADWVVVFDRRPDRPPIRIFRGSAFQQEKIQLRPDRFRNDTVDGTGFAKETLLHAIRKFGKNRTEAEDYVRSALTPNEDQILRTDSDGKIVFFTRIDDCPFPLPDSGENIGV